MVRSEKDSNDWRPPLRSFTKPFISLMDKSKKHSGQVAETFMRNADWVNYQRLFSVTSFRSFLPTKQSVTTRILSSRWKLLWTLVPTLDYSNETIEGGVTCFQSFGSTSTRNPLPPKIEPQLVFWAWFLVLSWLDTWLRIAAAAPRKVEQLDLQLHLDWKPVVACSAVASLFLLLQHDFSGSQIKRQFYICYTLSIPNPTLKVLHLVHAFHLRVSACPVLEHISFKYLFLR